MPCDVCGSRLLFGKCGEKVLWCPNCENIRVFSYQEAIEHSMKLFEETRLACDVLLFTCNKFNMMANMLNAREMTARHLLSELHFNANEFIWETFIIHDILAGKCKSEVVFRPSVDFLGGLFQAYFDHVESCSYIHWITEGYGTFITVPAARIRDHTTKKKSALLSFDGKHFILFRYYEEWTDILREYKKHNVVPGAEAEKISRKYKAEVIKNLLKQKRTKKRLRRKKVRRDSPHLLSVYFMLTLVFYSSFPDPRKELLGFEEIEVDENLIYAMHELSKFAVNFLDEQNKKGKDVSNLFFAKVHVNEVEGFLRDRGFDSEKILSQLVSREGDPKPFPLMVQMGDFLGIPPQALEVMSWYFSHDLFKKEINIMRTREGYRFEGVVCKKLNEIGISTSDPLKPENELKNICDKKKRTLEIDIIAHDDKNIYVIDCKSNSISILWYFKRYQDYRIRDLKNEIDKRLLSRIEWVKEHLHPKKDFHFYKFNPITGELVREKRESLGFDPMKFDVKGLIVTAVKENLSEYKGVKIIPIYELQKLIGT
jgi:hypothetical protein